jgi:hypothetical protein
MLELKWVVAQDISPEVDVVRGTDSLMVLHKPLMLLMKNSRRLVRKLLLSKMKMLLPKVKKRRPLRIRSLPMLMPPTKNPLLPDSL